ncbi:TRAP transporter large permease [Pseudorhodoplanes sp.]|uniref:TRAP transporter large permease n=1 Tax=Pseudorhodoplanes sp. TaxID=1934341 RepID=UPI003D0D4C97
MSMLAIGTIGLGLTIVLMIVRVPVGIALGVVGFVGFTWITNFDTALKMLGLAPYSAVASDSLTVIPLFILMGQFASQAGLSRDLFAVANSFLGHRRGGLAMATVAACGGFAAICGSSLATAATMSATALPEMRRYGYDVRLSTGSIAAGGTIGILIPPSIILLIYGFLTEQSIGKLFLAGVVPGIVMIGLFMLTIQIVVALKPSLAPRAERAGLKSSLSELAKIADVAVLFIIVIGGMYVGIFTATEGAAVGAAGAFGAAVLRRRMSLEAFVSSLIETAKLSAMIFAILLGAIILGYFLTVTQMPSLLAQFITDLKAPPFAIMGAIIVSYLIMGALMDEMAMILLTVPIFYPVSQALGFDPIWFGVIIVIVCQAGMIAPPVGINVFLLAGMNPDIPLASIYRGILPFLAAMVVLLGLLMVFPDIALWLPRTMK